MAITNPDLIVKKGEQIYEKNKDFLEKNHLGEFVAININTGEYYTEKTPEDASKRAKDAHPGDINFLCRIGPDKGVYRLRTFRGNHASWSNYLGGAGR